MPNTVTILSNSVRGRYEDDYIDGAMSRRVYDFFCYPISQDLEKMQRQTSITVPFLAGMSVGSSAISETLDITPQTLKDSTASLTPSSRGEAIQDSELLLIQSYTDYGSKRYEIVGENMQETVEAYLIDTALAGSLVYRATARASLDAGTSGHRLSDTTFGQMTRLMAGLKCPEAEGVMGEGAGALYAVMNSDPYYDLRTGGNILSIAQYQRPEIILDGELGYLAPYRILATPWGKVFNGAGAAFTTSADTTLSAATEPLAKTMVVASSTNDETGEYLNVGTVETANTFHPMNERVRYVSGTTTVTFVGQAVNGGLKYEHASGSTVNNSDSVYPILFGGPQSIAKAYASEIGEYGQVVGPKMQGLLEQFVSLGWKWYGGFARISENWLGRGEVSCSLDA